jgi:hypothetical protein
MAVPVTASAAVNMIIRLTALLIRRGALKPEDLHTVTSGATAKNPLDLDEPHADSRIQTDR